MIRYMLTIINRVRNENVLGEHAAGSRALEGIALFRTNFFLVPGFLSNMHIYVDTWVPL